MVGGEIPLVVPGPGLVVLVVLHKLPLAAEVLAPLPEGVLPIAVQLAHLGDLGGHRVGQIGKAPAHPGQGGVAVDHPLGLGLVLQDDGGPGALPALHRPVQQAAHFLPVGVAPKGDPHPLGALHPVGFGEVRGRVLPEHLLPALDVAVLYLLALVVIPKPHEQRHPLAGGPVRQHRDPRELRPLVLLRHAVGLSGVGRKLSQVHANPLLSGAPDFSVTLYYRRTGGETQVFCGVFGPCSPAAGAPALQGPLFCV